ncbi:DUF2637 domain-containing protein [Streptomyces carpaticus]|uniref:DUF2637 domain-containing protein n=1 Tax=Streptomyces carpaticus TaxID=285558 RepID=A0ABV4ZGW7_9ACTN
MSGDAPIPARITGWDRAAIVALGGAGCALSYDALQQMATAIHVRGALTYLFPLVIDGFIAYGVRALLVMRSATFAARLYIWMLFGTATAASIWANALHAVRLNQQLPEAGGLRLGDATVGVLSTLAPLALAGAVHLYILIARRVTEIAVPSHPGEAGQPGQPGQPTPGHPPARTGQAANRKPSPEANAPADQGGHPQEAVTDDLLPLARQAVTDTGRVTRAVVAKAIRGQGLPLSNARLTDLMGQLRTDLGQSPGQRLG